MGVSDQALASLRPLSERELGEWEEAYSAVECYFRALRIRNRLLLAEIVRGILWRASARRMSECDRTARELAMEEAMREVANWTQDVLGEPLPSNRLAARGRLALLLADMPGRWQPAFLAPQPWPDEFVAAMRNSYLAAGPGFASMAMKEQRLELNALASGAASWWESMDRRPIVRRMTVAAVAAFVIGVLWFMFL
jgi:hypothetical protein